jgi:hypothetical protein
LLLPLQQLLHTLLLLLLHTLLLLSLLQLLQQVGRQAQSHWQLLLLIRNNTRCQTFRKDRSHTATPH